MSTQKGNVQRKRPQKYKNTKAFKNDLHDTSKEIKQLNSVTFDNLCSRCAEIIQWRVKFKKYHQLTNPKVCVKCNEKTVKQAYHTVCKNCSSALKICAKCGKSSETIAFDTTVKQEDINQEFLDAIKNIRERERRTLLRMAQSSQNSTGISGTDEAEGNLSSHEGDLTDSIKERLSNIKCDDDSEYASS
ncbi:unnamed protein product [Trichobilharzia szidati]|nr:unnamed protein product [Trichobilharzia szidati]